MRRLDLELTARGLAPSRSRAAAMIKAGQVSVNGKSCQRAAEPISPEDAVETTGGHGHVGRGGLKLQAAFELFAPDVGGLEAIDVGASTGGFTQCLLNHGAALVYAVDVGHGQLAPALLSDDRVINMEGYNFRIAEPEHFEPRPQFASCDVSFISLKHILPPLFGVLADGAKAIVLIKPQFEQESRQALDKHGIVKTEQARGYAVARAHKYASDAGFTVVDTVRSPVEGGGGNIEYLCLMEKS